MSMNNKQDQTSSKEDLYTSYANYLKTFNNSTNKNANMSSALVNDTDNQQGPFWDFVNELQDQGPTHPWFVRYQRQKARAAEANASGNEEGLPNAWRDARVWTMPHRGRHGHAHGWGHGGGPAQRGQEVPVQDDEDMLTPTSSDGETVPPTAPDHHHGHHHGGRRGGARGFGKGRGGFGGRGRGGPHGHGPHAHHHHHHHHTGDENALSGDEMCRGPPGMGGRGRFGGRGGGGHGGRGRGRGCGMGRGGGAGGASRDIDNDKAGEVEETSRTASAEPICRRPAGMRHLGPLPANPEHNDKFTPETDFFSHPEAYIVHVSLPGAKKEDIEVNWVAERSILRITGEVKRPADEDVLKNMVTDERKAGKFERRIRLGNWVNPASVDVDGITAKLEDGILRVEVPKLEAEFVEIKKVDIY